jgi:hypothetical protein
MTRRDAVEDIERPRDLAIERHYTEAEIAAIWHMHRKTIHKIFDTQPGVLEFGEDGHRSLCTLGLDYQRYRHIRRNVESVTCRFV